MIGLHAACPSALREGWPEQDAERCAGKHIFRRVDPPIATLATRDGAAWEAAGIGTAPDSGRES